MVFMLYKFEVCAFCIICEFLGLFEDLVLWVNLRHILYKYTELLYFL